MWTNIPAKRGVREWNGRFARHVPTPKTRNIRGYANLLQGQELDASFKIERELWQTICEGSSFNSTLELYSSALQDPPDWADRLGVRKEGKILTRLQSIVPTKIKNNEKTGKKVFRWQFHVQVDFRSETGILGFKTLIDGAEAGTTTIAFEY